MYTSTYPVDTQTCKITILHHHTALPPGAMPDSFGLAIDAIEFQIAMYGMAEVLEYSALMSFAYGKLVSYFIFDRKATQHVAHLIRLVFAPAGSLDRKCKDEVGALKGLGIAAVLVHEKKHWTGHEMDDFRDLLASELGQDAWKEYRACYKQIKDANKNLLKEPSPINMRSASQNIGSLVSSMSNVAITGNSKPKLSTELHALFDEYAYWSIKALKVKTGQSGQAINEALQKIATQVHGTTFNGCWQRKSHFKRTSLYQCTEQMGHVKPLSMYQSTPQLAYPSYSQQMGIGHHPTPKRTFGLPTVDTRESIPLAKRKFAEPSRSVVSRTSVLEIFNNNGKDNSMVHDATEATGMLGSSHAPKAPKIGINGAANATFTFAGRTLDFSSTPAAPQAGTISLEGLKKLQEVGVASKQANNTVKIAEKAEAEAARKDGMDADGNKENIPVEINYAVPKVEEEKEAGDEEMVD
jgi:hypothetical protein